MTPAEWHELDEARKAYVKDIRNWNRLALQMTNHFDELIDAARPKCGTCSGDGSYLVQRERHLTDCHDCFGTGWA